MAVKYRETGDKQYYDQLVKSIQGMTQMQAETAQQTQAAMQSSLAVNNQNNTSQTAVFTNPPSGVAGYRNDPAPISKSRPKGKRN